MGNDLGLQYIMDGNGNYYTLNASDHLVVARDREEASVFTFFEANQRIGGGKRARFYHTISVEELEKTEQDMIGESEGLEHNDEVITLKKCQPDFEYNIEDTDWSEFVNYFIFLATSARRYQDELAKRHSDVEKEICDLLHYVELYDLTETEGLKAMVLLKDARQRRRGIKDEISRMEFFQKMIGTSANVAKARGFLTELEKLGNRKYSPRQLTDLFDGMESKLTNRELHKENHFEQVTDETELLVINGADMEDQEMSYVETIYDHRENDWLGFAKQQMEFYQNAGQYMVNLQIEIQEIEQAIEEVMDKIENANYNVTQGYKVFRELKDLRNERKAKVKELDVLRAMTECFDLNSMAEAYSYNVDEINRITTKEACAME